MRDVCDRVEYLTDNWVVLRIQSQDVY